MVLSIFKNGDGLFNEAVDLVRRGEYSGARSKFEKAIEKGCSQPDQAKASIAIISAGLNRGHNNLRNSAKILQSIGPLSFGFGLSDVDTAVMAEEMLVLAESMEARAFNGKDLERGEKLLAASSHAAVSIGDREMQLNSIFDKFGLTGTKLSQELAAEGYEAMAEGTVWDNPRKAAEYQQMAYGYRRQLGESGERNRQLMESYSKSVICWFCGRQCTGESHHFVEMEGDISPQHLESKDGLPTNNGSGMVYACRGCYSAVYRVADSIAAKYHQMALAEIAAAESRIYASMSFREVRYR